MYNADTIYLELKMENNLNFKCVYVYEGSHDTLGISISLCVTSAL